MGKRIKVGRLCPRLRKPYDPGSGPQGPAKRERARQGLVAGGMCFGYDMTEEASDRLLAELYERFTSCESRSSGR